MTQPTSSAGTQEAASMAAVRLLREIVDYQQRLRRLREHEAAGDQTYLISAYQRAMTLRRELLDDLYKPPESVPSPFDPNASFDPDAPSDPNA